MSGSPALRLEGDVLAARRGDPAAFAHLVDATRTTVTSIALAILGDVELSAERLIAWCCPCPAPRPPAGRPAPR